MKIKQKLSRIIPDEMKTPLKFLLIVLLITIIISFFNYSKTISSLIYAGNLLLKLIPTLLLVWFIMGLFNMFIGPKKLAKHLGKEKPIKAWIISSIAGIISSGPIYLWYPLLAEAKEKGASNSSIAIFLYNRAVKPALLPLMIVYFGITYTIVLTIVMILVGGLQGLMIEKIV